MAAISNDQELKQALDNLDEIQQRVVGAHFVQSVIELSIDDRINKAVQTALNPDADADELKNALQSVNSAILDCYTRCGAEGDWKAQASYFVGRAAAACLAPKILSEGKAPAWHAALNCRMACTSAIINTDSAVPEQENNKQYEIVSGFLDRNS